MTQTNKQMTNVWFSLQYFNRNEKLIIFGATLIIILIKYLIIFILILMIKQTLINNKQNIRIWKIKNNKNFKKKKKKKKPKNF